MLLLERVGPKIRGLKSVHAPAPDEVLKYNGQLQQLRHRLHHNMGTVKQTLGGDGMQELFAKADGDGNGLLSLDEGVALLDGLQSAMGGEPILSSREEMSSLIAYIDLDGNGCVSFVEFLVAFGLASTTHHAHDLDEPSERGASERAAAEPDGRDADDVDVFDSVLHQVCSALYERQHTLMRAFRYLDVHGAGYVNVDDFERAITLVMTHIAPRGAAAAERPLDGRLHGIDASQVSSLVSSLKGSHLLIEKPNEPAQVDYLAFIQAFEVVDTQPDL